MTVNIEQGDSGVRTLAQEKDDLAQELKSAISTPQTEAFVEEALALIYAEGAGEEELS